MEFEPFRQNERCSYPLGEAHLPSSFFDPENYKINNQAILRQLNESNIFDTPLLFKPKDKLVIAFGETIFAYIFSKDKWKTREYDYFKLENEHNEIEFGKIKKKSLALRGLTIQ